MQIVSDILLLAGAAVFVLAGVGLLRLPDMFSRISSIGTAGGVGTALIVLGVALQNPDLINLLKGGIAVALQLITSSVGAIILARAAVLSGHHFARQTDTTDAEELGTLVEPESVHRLHEDD